MCPHIQHFQYVEIYGHFFRKSVRKLQRLKGLNKILQGILDIQERINKQKNIYSLVIPS